ncbi:hypothetical protein LZ32DRAFT_501068, partial [Colletotrichum eremochloae]
ELFRDYRKQPVKYLKAEDHERKYCFYDCENIAFQTAQGDTIWETAGHGEIKIPAGVGVYMVWGK